MGFNVLLMSPNWAPSPSGLDGRAAMKLIQSIRHMSMNGGNAEAWNSLKQNFDSNQSFLIGTIGCAKTQIGVEELRRYRMG